MAKTRLSVNLGAYLRYLGLHIFCEGVIPTPCYSKMQLREQRT